MIVSPVNRLRRLFIHYCGSNKVKILNTFYTETLRTEGIMAMIYSIDMVMIIVDDASHHWFSHLLLTEAEIKKSMDQRF